jgi:hypothetical protein
MLHANAVGSEKPVDRQHEAEPAGAWLTMLHPVLDHPVIASFSRNVLELLSVMSHQARTLEPSTWVLMVLGLSALVMFTLVRPR